MNGLDLVLDRPIAFHRSFVSIRTKTGGKLGVAAALMLSQAIYWARRSSDDEGWFYKTQEEWEEETGLTRREQETARKRLRATDFWHEELRGMPARLHFRVDFEALAAALGLCQTSLHESAQQVCTNPPNKFARKRQTIPYITETTTETTSKKRLSSEDDSSVHVVPNKDEGEAAPNGAVASQRSVMMGAKKEGEEGDALPLRLYRHYCRIRPNRLQAEAILREVEPTKEGIAAWKEAIRWALLKGIDRCDVQAMLSAYRKIKEGGGGGQRFALMPYAEALAYWEKQGRPGGRFPPEGWEVSKDEHGRVWLRVPVVRSEPK